MILWLTKINTSKTLTLSETWNLFLSRLWEMYEYMILKIILYSIVLVPEFVSGNDFNLSFFCNSLYLWMKTHLYFRNLNEQCSSSKDIKSKMYLQDWNRSMKKIVVRSFSWTERESNEDQNIKQMFLLLIPITKKAQKSRVRLILTMP